MKRGRVITLDEAILHAEEVAESCQLKAYDIERDDYKDLEECAAEHRQLAEWLRELKAYKNKYHKYYKPRRVSDEIKRN